MTVLAECTDALLYLLDYMVGIDKNLDAQETRYFIRIARQLHQDDFLSVQKKIQRIAQLGNDPQHDPQTLLQEACATIRKEQRAEEAVQMLRKMAAVDGHIHDREQALFDQICQLLGIPTSPLTLDANAAS
ncbi:TerB family tellurite resistance protein [Myxococcota bacterium]|nr:TerB family tellurite resistance protein [Myxococcota bacterium]